jgi:uncharacterized protein involved in outer membrane biogenesis
MRKWITAVIVLMALCVSVALLSIGLLIAKNKNYLLDRAERTLGRKIQLGAIEVSFLPPFGIRFNNLTVSDDSAYSHGPFLEARRLQLDIEFLPLLLQRVRIKKITVHDPMISVIRNQLGNYNFATLGSSEKRTAVENGQGKVSDTHPKSLNAALLVQSIEIINGTVRYRDVRSDLTVTRVDLTVANFTLNAPFTLDLAAAMFTASQNVRIQTSLGPIEGASGLTEVPLNGRIDAQELDMDKIRVAAPTLRKSLPRALDLRGVYTIKDLRFQGTFNRPKLKGAVEGTEASVRFD